ncbi:hypothetical protein AAG747_19265 [Rapidithrix thailandica]|uniref:Uncharacterized protein n=1 Tax=Rapidithrix thailandica TaxID=413964 RepID=A0AAW9SH94_9BACT
MKWINKIKMRKIIHRKETYLWKRAHYHLDNYEFSECVEQIVIYLENFKNSPIKLHFREEDNVLINSRDEKGKWMVGYPDSGVIWFSNTGKTVIQGENSDCKQINLNRPAVIIKLIDYYLFNGWNPKFSKQSFVVNDALRALEFIDFPKEKMKTES